MCTTCEFLHKRTKQILIYWNKEEFYSGKYLKKNPYLITFFNKCDKMVKYYISVLNEEHCEEAYDIMALCYIFIENYMVLDKRTGTLKRKNEFEDSINMLANYMIKKFPDNYFGDCILCTKRSNGKCKVLYKMVGKVGYCWAYTDDENWEEKVKKSVKEYEERGCKIVIC